MHELRHVLSDKNWHTACAASPQRFFSFENSGLWPRCHLLHFGSTWPRLPSHPILNELCNQALRWNLPWTGHLQDWLSQSIIGNCLCLQCGRNRLWEGQHNCSESNFWKCWTSERSFASNLWPLFLFWTCTKRLHVASGFRKDNKGSFIAKRWCSLLILRKEKFLRRNNTLPQKPLKLIFEQAWKVKWPSFDFDISTFFVNEQHLACQSAMLPMVCLFSNFSESHLNNASVSCSECLMSCDGNYVYRARRKTGWVFFFHQTLDALRGVYTASCRLLRHELLSKFSGFSERSFAWNFMAVY